MKLHDLIDPLLHVPLAISVVAACWLHPGVGAALFLWNREAAQKDAHDYLAGMDLRTYSLQKHLEIWPPAIVVGVIWELARRLL